MKNNVKFLTANWNAPKKVKTLITTKIGGYSQGACSTFNLALHVGDDQLIVEQNRHLLASYLPNKPGWLNQTHSNHVVDLDDTLSNTEKLMQPADAALTKSRNKVCVIMTADCLPIFLTDTKASFVAAIHAGWRGLQNLIIRETIKNSKVSGHDLIAYIGSAICKQHFEVGREVFDIFTAMDMDNEQFFAPKDLQKFNCDLTGLAWLQLAKQGLQPQNIYRSNECTYCNSHLFYSYRRENLTGRFASCIWLE